MVDMRKLPAELEDAVAVTFWIRPGSAAVAREGGESKEGFEAEFYQALLDGGIFANDRWGRRNATQIAKGLLRAGVRTWDDLKTVRVSQVLDRSGLVGIKAGALETAIVSFKGTGKVTGEQVAREEGEEGDEE